MRRTRTAALAVTPAPARRPAVKVRACRANHVRRRRSIQSASTRQAVGTAATARASTSTR
jgi:hypothetical protein